MHFIFAGCNSLKSLDITNFNTSNVKDMGGMFSSCQALTSIEVNSFNTSKVTDMSAMFSDCKSLTMLDLNIFDTSKVITMDRMFACCYSMKTIYAGNWGRSASDTELFHGCDQLVGGQGTKIGNNLYGYDEKGNPLYYNCPVDGRAAHIDGGKGNPGLFTAK